MTTNYDSRRYALVNRWDARHLKTVQRLVQPNPGQRILEVGCGRGHLVLRLQAMGVEAVGVDANTQAAGVAVANGVLPMRAESLEFDDSTFDAVVSIHAIEHIPALEMALFEMARVLRPGGKMLLIYPAEPVKGLFAIPTSVILHGTPWKAGQIHVHRLYPKRLRNITRPLGLWHLHSEFNLVSSPQFVTLLTKP